MIKFNPLVDINKYLDYYEDASSYMATITDPAIDAAVLTTIIDVYDGIVITLTAAGNAQTLQNPTDVAPGKSFTVVSNDSNTHTIAVNGITLLAGEAQRFIWDGAAWCYLKGGTDDIYDTTYIDAAGMIPCTTNGALQGTKEYGTNDIDVDYFAFDAGATEERVQFKLKMPESWDRSTVKVKFDWSSDTSSTTGDTVEWAIKAGAISDSDVIDAALGIPQVISDTLLADNGVDLQTTLATPAITVGGTPSLGDVIIFEIYRNTDGTDDMAEDAFLLGCTIQYKKTNIVTAW